MALLTLWSLKGIYTEDDHSAHTCNMAQQYDIVDASEVAGCHLHLDFAASSLPKTLTSWLPSPRFLARLSTVVPPSVAYGPQQHQKNHLSLHEG